MTLPRLPTLTEWIALLGGFYEGWGYPLVLVAAALENTLLVTFFFPGGTMVLLGGVYSRIGTLELPLVILVGWIGTFLGASFDFAVGRLGKRTLLGRMLRLPLFANPLAYAGLILARYGLLALLGGHFISHLRSLVSVAAAVTGMPYRRFALLEAPAALAWTTVYAVGGHFLAGELELFEAILARFGLVVGVVLAVFFAWQVREMVQVVRQLRGAERLGQDLP